MITHLHSNPCKICCPTVTNSTNSTNSTSRSALPNWLACCSVCATRNSWWTQSGLFVLPSMTPTEWLLTYHNTDLLMTRLIGGSMTSFLNGRTRDRRPPITTVSFSLPSPYLLLINISLPLLMDGRWTGVSFGSRPLSQLKEQRKRIRNCSRILSLFGPSTESSLSFHLILIVGNRSSQRVHFHSNRLVIAIFTHLYYIPSTLLSVIKLEL